jgi:hypothetical protein
MAIEALIRKNNNRFPTGNKFAMTRMCSWLCMENIHALEILTPYQVQHVLEASTALFSGEETKLLLRLNSYPQLESAVHSFEKILTPRIYVAAQTFSLIQNARLRAISQTGRGGKGALPGTISPEQLVTLSLMSAIINSQDLRYYDAKELGQAIKSVRGNLVKELTVETEIPESTMDLFNNTGTKTVKRKVFQLPEPINNPPPVVQAAALKILNHVPRLQESVPPHSGNFYWGIQSAAQAEYFTPIFHTAAFKSQHGIFAHPAIGPMAKIAMRHTDDMQDLTIVASDLLLKIPANYCPSICDGQRRTLADPVTHPNYAAYAIATTRNNLKAEKKNKKVVQASRNGLRIANYFNKLAEVGNDPQAIQAALDKFKSVSPEKNLLKKFRPDASHLAHHLKMHTAEIKETLPSLENTGDRIEFLTALCLESDLLADAIREANGLFKGEGTVISLDAPVRQGDGEEAPSLHNSFGGKVEDVYFSEGVEPEQPPSDSPDLIAYQEFMDYTKHGDPQRVPAEPAAVAFTLSHEITRVLGNAPEQDFAIRALSSITLDRYDPKIQIGLEKLLEKHMGRLSEPAKTLLLMAANGPKAPLHFRDGEERRFVLDKIAENIALRATGFDTERLKDMKKNSNQFSLGL